MMEINNWLFPDDNALNSCSDMLGMRSQVSSVMTNTPAVPSPVPSLTSNAIPSPIPSPVYSVTSNAAPSPPCNLAFNAMTSSVPNSMPIVTSRYNAMTIPNPSLTIEDEESIQIAISSVGKLIRDELREKIHCQRRNKGQDEIKSDFEEKPRDMPCELSVHDVIRQDSRRDQNRRASKKYRHKQRCKTTELYEEMAKEESLNTVLQQEVKGLCDEVQRLKSALLTHQTHCVNVNLSSATPISPQQDVTVSLIYDDNTATFTQLQDVTVSAICDDNTATFTQLQDVTVSAICDDNTATFPQLQDVIVSVICDDNTATFPQLQDLTVSAICDDHTDTYPQHLIPIYSDIS